MSLVLDALRRVEKSDGGPGSVGVSVGSYRSRRLSRASMLLPLLLGAGTAAAFLYPFGRSSDKPAVNGSANQSQPPSSVVPPNVAPVAARSVSSPQLPTPEPPVASATIAANRTPRVESVSTTAKAKRSPAGSVAAAGPQTLVLQATSEREGRPIAMVSDQLVREGDTIGGARIVKIGAESIDVLFESGRREVVRFAPPPPAPTPEPN
jgi:hypothetical protein